MTFYDQIFYEITLKGTKSELKKFTSFLRSGGLDDFFEFDEEKIIYGDNYALSPNDAVTDITILDEDGVELEELCVEDFLEVFCAAAKKLDVYGFVYDEDEREFNFISEAGNDYFENSRDFSKFNDELDDLRDEEELDEDEEE